MFSTLLNDNPYAGSTSERLLADAAAAPVDPGQPPTYSNLGVALLGTALVRASGMPDYPSLVERRITGPLGMTGTSLAGAPGDVPEGAIGGFAANGLAAPRWTGTGYLPAGTSTFTTVSDLAGWAQAQLSGRAPGREALEPTADLEEGTRIGWAWMTTTTRDGRATTWHNGETAGFRTMLAIDAEGGRAVVVMGNTSAEVATIALALLHGTPRAAPGPQPLAILLGALPVALAALFGLTAVRRAFREEAILPVITGLLTAVFGLMLLWTSGPWTAVGGWLWGLALAPVLAGSAILAARAGAAPLLPRRRAWLAWVELVVGLALVVLGFALW